MEAFISEFNYLAIKAINSYQITSAPSITLIYGPSGSGKTYLLDYIFQKIKPSGINIAFIDALTFAKDYAYAVYENKFTSFRQRYRFTELLIIDNLHLLNGKKKNLEELYHTCESITSKKGKIIIAINGDLSSVNFLDGRFRSRLLGGGIISIKEPQKEEVFRFLQYYLKDKSININVKIIHEVAQNFPKLNDAVFHIDKFLVNCLSQNLKLDLVNLYIYLKTFNEQRLIKKDPENILNYISRINGITTADILNKKRSPEYIKVRQLAIYMIRRYCNLSYPQIGKIFARNHSAIMYAYQQVEAKSLFDEDLKAQIAAINNHFNNNERGD